MDYVYEYLMFLAQVATIVVAIVIVVTVIASAAMKPHDESPGHLSVQKLNDRLKDLRRAMQGALLPQDVAKKRTKEEAKLDKAEAKAAAKAAGATDDDKPERSRVFVLQFSGDVKATAIEHLRQEISAVLTMATANDEVVVCVESPGGMVHSYGLAASQLSRVRSKQVPLTVVVDKVAASGGYLMAAVANKILAAPFALIGSIGVVAQVPNVHRLLKKNDVDVEVLTAGKHKRTLTVFGENTEEGRQKFLEELEDVHALFQEYVASNRPDLDIQTVATGEAWYGTRALELNLVDELSTSDEYLMNACEERDVYEVKWVEHLKPIDKLMNKVNGLLEHATQLVGGWQRG